MEDPVGDGRSACGRGAWGDAYRHLSSVEAEELTPDDLHSLGIAAYLTGREHEGEVAMELAHRQWRQVGNRHRAAREAFWIGLMHVDRHELSPASGWFARGERLLEGIDECAEAGLLRVPAALQALVTGDPRAALAGFRAAGEIGERVDDHDLCALARLGEGQSLVMLGRVDDGMRLLDEMMVGVVAHEPSPLVTGLLYCAVIETCERVLDLRRSAEWTAALSTWCDAQPGLESHRGRCLVHRAAVLRYRGEWNEALIELDRARTAFASLHRPALGAVFYELGELHRLRGEVEAAEEAYREASRLGHDPRPGLPLLRLLQGRGEEAWSSLVDCEDASNPGRAAHIQAASIEVALACGRLDDAGSAGQQLRTIAREVDTDYVTGLADLCDGRILLASDDAAGACEPLRAAIRTWQPMPVPLEEARARVSLGAARLALGDKGSTMLELDAARRVFTSLGAQPDLRDLREIEAAADLGAKSLLTDRELEVLAHVARGLTNREIAEVLVVSQHTVRRHLQNVFAKLGASSRVGAVTRAREIGFLR